MIILTVCALYSGHDYVIRRSFFDVLRDFMRSFKCYGPRIRLGDFNVRVHYQGAGEDSVVGPYVFANSCVAHELFSSRSMLLELCQSFRVF